MSEATLPRQIEEAFSDVQFPGADRLVDSDSREAKAVASAFRNCTNWRELDAEFLNSAPDGLGSALNFFSPEAFRFFLPAYLLADIAGKLPFVEPDFSLCYQFSEGWDDGSSLADRNGVFTPGQCKVIADYLTLRLKRCEDPMIERALKEYWMPRCEQEK